MKKFIQGLVLGMFAFGFVAGASAADRATKEDVQKAVKAVIAFHKANGKEKTLAELNKPDNQFKAKEAYPFAYNADGVNLAHLNQKMVGKNLMQMKDADGVEINRLFIETANKSGSGWVKYKWPNPVSKEIEPKESYVEKFEDVYYMMGYHLPK
ncbi:MAG: hypothetical protein RL748_2909 [Pseudomonadota bacterium]|jgi:signal transduction histidine kinase